MHLELFMQFILVPKSKISTVVVTDEAEPRITSICLKLNTIYFGSAELSLSL